MKFAIINGIKTLATKGSKGFCPICNSELIAKCGELKINHWSHKGKQNCDPWWENETIWHRTWKDRFPTEWQEIVHFDKNGEKHIADIKTPDGWAIEFQHSFLNPDERRSRNAFYGKLIWIIDGTRRKRDKDQFLSQLKEGICFGAKAKIWRVNSHDCVLMQEWENCHTPVFFDFGYNNLWWVLDGISNGIVYITPISCESFIELHNVGEKIKIHDFNEFVNDIGKLAQEYEANYISNLKYQLNNNRNKFIKR